jgi:hypothetical protein
MSAFASKPAAAGSLGSSVAVCPVSGGTATVPAGRVRVRGASEPVEGIVAAVAVPELVAVVPTADGAFGSGEVAAAELLVVAAVE